MNKIYRKIVRSFMFGTVLSIIVVLIAAIASFLNGDRYSGLIELVFCLALVVYIYIVRQSRKSEMDGYMKMLSDGGQMPDTDIIQSFPLPMVILRVDGSIMWFNRNFANVFGENVFDAPLDTVVSDIKWSEILKSTSGICEDVHYKGHHYEVLGSIIKNEKDEQYSVLLYFCDRTEQEKLEKKYQNERVDVAIISIDNYDEILQKMDDTQRQQALAQIDKDIGEWVLKSNGIRRRTERDRYIVFFEHQYLERYIEEKFDVIDKVRALGESTKHPLTISIGIGVGGHLAENEAYARAAIDMVLGRGGDQAAIKDESQYRFYGGKTKEYEKSTRVKARAFALALKDFILHADNVIFMGHSNADYDSFGAAIGLQRAVRDLGKNPYIIFDNTIGVQKLFDETKEIEEYSGMMIESETAMEIIGENTLLVVLDTHRPSLVSSPELLAMASKTVLIDHHRRSTEFINNCSLVYHEPYASSTCEMATEILQYIDDGRKMTTFEAKALYVGILMDTKNFVMKTGVRTFEAASYLRRYGVDTISVKSLFDIDKADYAHKVDIVKSAEFIEKNIAVAVCSEKFHNIKVISAKAADEMLEISNVEAAFVIFEEDGDACISGRSLGDVNVQVILEKLGGGGHMMVAGTQLNGISIEQAKEMLISAVKEYLDEND